MGYRAWQLAAVDAEKAGEGSSFPSVDGQNPALPIIRNIP